MRAEIASLADGRYEAVDHVDGFGDDPEPIAIRLALTIHGDELEIDFTGTSEQVDASLNCPLGLIYAACYCAIRGVTRADIPNCEGYMSPIRVVAPEGTVVNPVSPAACGARGVIGYRVYDTIMRALAQVVPDRVVAAGEGGPTLVAFGGYDEHRRPFGTTEVIVGAWGARATRDGLEGVSNPLANLSNQPIELLESDLPLEIVQYRLVPDSGGAGERRGGLAYEREYRVRAERATLTIRSDRRLHPALRARRRPARRTVPEHDRRRRGRERCPADADGCADASPWRPLPSPVGGRWRLRLPARARSCVRARGRAGREGERRRRARRSTGSSWTEPGESTRLPPRRDGERRERRRRDPERPRDRRHRSAVDRRRSSGSPASASSRSARFPRRRPRSMPPASTSPPASSTSTATRTTPCSSTPAPSARSTRASPPRSSGTAGTGASRSPILRSRNARSTDTRRRCRSRGAMRPATSSASRPQGRR